MERRIASSSASRACLRSRGARLAARRRRLAPAPRPRSRARPARAQAKRAERQEKRRGKMSSNRHRQISMTKKDLTLCPMIGVAGKDRRGAVELLGEQNAHELMRPGHPAEGEAAIGCGRERLRPSPSGPPMTKTVRGTEAAASLASAGGKGRAVDQLAAGVEADDAIAVRKPRQRAPPPPRRCGRRRARRATSAISSTANPRRPSFGPLFRARSR